MLNPSITIGVMAETHSEEELARNTAKQWNLDYVEEQKQGIVLVKTDNRLELRNLDEPKTGAVFVDFASDALTYRRHSGGGKKESIIKALGVKGNQQLHVIDATAGLGRDAFVMACHGCKVDLIERSPHVAALLEDGLRRAALHPELHEWLPQMMTLHHGISYQLLKDWSGSTPDAIYLDPMFPHRKKSALVKKEMRLFQQLLGVDDDSDKLLEPAVMLASKRVVVKRPDVAPHLNEQKPTMAITSKKHRFDVYLNIGN